MEYEPISVERAQEIILEYGGEIMPVLEPGQSVCIGMIPIPGGRMASVLSDGALSFTSRWGGETTTSPGSLYFPYYVRW
jgi:hypothetical protein